MMIYLPFLHSLDCLQISKQGGVSTSPATINSTFVTELPPHTTQQSNFHFGRCSHIRPAFILLRWPRSCCTKYNNDTQGINFFSTQKRSNVFVLYYMNYTFRYFQTNKNTIRLQNNKWYCVILSLYYVYIVKF